MAAPNKSKVYNKKANKNVTEGNILVFYALQCAASVVLKTNVTASKIVFKSPTKSQVGYEYPNGSKLTDDQRKQIQYEVNDMFESHLSVSCSKYEKNADDKIATGINGEGQLYSIQIKDKDKKTAISHIPITINNLGLLSNFNIIKCNFKQKKNLLEFQYSFQLDTAKHEPHKHQPHQPMIQTKSYFEEEKEADVRQYDIRTEFSKEIINSVLSELKIKEKQINKEDLDKALNQVHDIMNRFQSITYSRGYQAAKINKN